MSEEQENKIDRLTEQAEAVILNAHKAQKISNRLIWTFAIAIFIAVSSVTTLVVSMVSLNKNINTVGTKALNKDAFYSYQKIDKAHDMAILKAINDPTIKDAIDI